MKNQKIINAALVIVALFLAYMVFNGLRQPVQFTNKCKDREAVVVAKLKDIRLAETFFKARYGRYTASFDSLANYINNEQIAITKIVHDVNDTTFTKNIVDTIGMKPVIDSIKVYNKNFTTKDFARIPFSNNEKFEIDAGFITRGGLKVAVVEVKAPYRTFLYGLDDQRIRNLAKQQEDINKYAGLKFGSMTEASDAGNWE